MAKIHEERGGCLEMPVTVKVPTPLRKFTAGSESVEGEGANVGAVIDDLESRHGGIRERICDEQGKVRRFVNLYLNGEDIRFLQQLDTAVNEGDEIAIVPAIAGGSR
jgi:molybdopterin synthase sulfur carrier subunit